MTDIPDIRSMRGWKCLPSRGGRSRLYISQVDIPPWQTVYRHLKRIYQDEVTSAIDSLISYLYPAPCYLSMPLGGFNLRSSVQYRTISVCIFHPNHAPSTSDTCETKPPSSHPSSCFSILCSHYCDLVSSLVPPEILIYFTNGVRIYEHRVLCHLLRLQVASV